MKIAIIGAGGFVGQRVALRLSERDDVDEIRLVDRTPLEATAKARLFQGDFAEVALRNEALDQADAVICLASVLGGAAEIDPALARRINLDATMDLIEHLKATAPRTRFVFASTIATYGAPMPDPVTDATPLDPSMVYGMQKAMIETMLSTFTRRRWLDAVSLRPSGVMARDGADSALKSAFMSQLFYAVKRGENIVLPVDPNSRTWLASVESVAQNFIHAAMLPRLGDTRAFTLPALSLHFGALVDALKRAFPNSGGQIEFAPDPQLVDLFGSFPTLMTETADMLGFTRDADVDALVRDAF